MCRLKKTISVLIPEDRLVCLGTQHSINQRNTCDTFIMQRVYAPRKPATGIPEGPAPRARRSPSPAAARWGRCLCCPLPRPHAGPTEEEAEGEAMIKRHGGNTHEKAPAPERQRSSWHFNPFCAGQVRLRYRSGVLQLHVAFPR